MPETADSDDEIWGNKITFKELEQLGYLERHQLRAANGRLGKVEYVIYEMPKGVVAKKPYKELSCHNKRPSYDSILS